MKDLLLERGLVPPEQLERYCSHVAANPHLDLLQVLHADGVLSEAALAELRQLSGAQGLAGRPSAAPAAAPAQGPILRRLAGVKRRFDTFDAPSAPQTPPAAPAPVLRGMNAPPASAHLAAPLAAQAFDAKQTAIRAAPVLAPAPAAAPVFVQAPAAAPSAAPAPAAAPRQAEESGGHGHGHAEAAASEPSVPEGWPGGIAPADPAPGGIQDYLKKARAKGASDLHFNAGVPPHARIHGLLAPLEDGHPVLQPADTERLVRMTLSPAQWKHFDRTGDLDFCYSYPGGGRCRANAFRERNGLGMKFRLIRENIPTLEELGLPPQAKRLTEFAQGLVLVTGPSGHGKTTTMMAMVELVNQQRPDHIITVEDPIEYTLAPKACQCSQREIGAHTASFAVALRAALRENPDIIVIGDLRDYEATSMAISAAETGHLVFASLPTQDAAKTIDKVLDYFPPEEQSQIRMMLSESLRGVLSQQLIPRKDGSGRVAAVELLFNSVGVANIIRDANTAGLTNAMQLGKNLGMVLMDESLKKLVDGGVIAGEEAWLRAANKANFQQFAPAKPAAPAAAAADKTPPVKR